MSVHIPENKARVHVYTCRYPRSMYMYMLRGYLHVVGAHKAAFNSTLLLQQECRSTWRRKVYKHVHVALSFDKLLNCWGP